MNGTGMTDDELLALRVITLIPNSVAKLGLTPKRIETICLKCSDGQVSQIGQLTLDQTTRVQEILNRLHQSRKSAAKSRLLKKENKCGRCGGVGRADKWERTGSVCYDCNGSGKRIL